MVAFDEAFEGNHAPGEATGEYDGNDPTEAAAAAAATAAAAASSALGSGTVVSVSSFTKTAAPGLRLGWVEASEALVSRLAGHGYITSGGGLVSYLVFFSFYCTTLVQLHAVIAYNF